MRAFRIKLNVSPRSYLVIAHDGEQAIDKAIEKAASDCNKDKSTIKVEFVNILDYPNSHILCL